MSEPTDSGNGSGPGNGRRAWFGRLSAGLRRSSQNLTQGINSIFAGRRIDAGTLSELEDLLITADLGPTTAARLTDSLRGRRFDADADADTVARALADEIAAILRPVAKPLRIGEPCPFVVLIVGVNGSGKTTTIGKLAHDLISSHGYAVMMAAGDTYRAAAGEQLRIWADRAGAQFFGDPAQKDPAALAFDAITAGKEDADVVLVDTAGRLHNKADLMAQLDKMVRVMKKVDPTAPHATILVLDATTGQNAQVQARTFQEMTNVTGLVVTKLDGSAKGGVLVALADQLGLPVHAIGVGEGIDDLRPFAPDDFARALLGLPPSNGA